MVQDWLRQFCHPQKVVSLSGAKVALQSHDNTCECQLGGRGTQEHMEHMPISL
jgi:hypothetical protein